MSIDEGDAHRHMRESLGAWVLGALDGDERRQVADHLATCADCAREVAALSPLPGLLNRLSADDPAQDLAVPSRRLRGALAADVQREDELTRRRLFRWRTAALVAGATAMVALVVAVAGLAVDNEPTAPQFDQVVAAARPVAAEATATSGEAAALAWEWGTTVELDLAALPVRDAYVLWAVADDGTREQAGTWGETDTHAARVRGASSIQRDDLATVEVADRDGTVLVLFDFPG